MIQRKQTLYLLVAIVLTLVCIWMPIATVEPEGMGISTLVYNLFVSGNGIELCVWPLFALLLVSMPIACVAIFMYKQRKRQAKLCSICMALDLLWVAYAAYILYTGSSQGNIHVKFIACLPIVAAILFALARKGIMDDERLVRAADRIR